MKVVKSADFKNIILQSVPLIDVRAPIEFSQGHIPNSVNLPILSDEHRHEIGIIYKEKGNAAAVNRGHELVSGEYKQQILQNWNNTIQKNPDSVITCFRGGQRSQITQAWLKELGIERPRIDGGYKAFRNFLIIELERLSARPMLVISGPTGSGKTKLIKQLTALPVVDLEALANHRGSAFGGQLQGQCSQADYENQLAAALIKAEPKGSKLIVEDESRMIGQITQPENFFNQLRASQLIYLTEPLENRVQTIFEEYILQVSPEIRPQFYDRYVRSLTMISKKLGGLRFQEIMTDLNQAISNSMTDGHLDTHRTWIEKLLVYYYDPMYKKSLDRRQPVVAFKGNLKEAADYLMISSL